MQPIVVVPRSDHAMVMTRDHPSFLKVTTEAYQILDGLSPADEVPDWLSQAIEDKWRLPAKGKTVAELIHVRKPSSYGYEVASWELNLLCNYNCAHCYLGERPNASLDLESRMEILRVISELGVYRLQITGGEPLIDKHFVETYEEAYRLGMVLSVSTNGSWLGKKSRLELLTKYRPLRITVSLYGASAESYEALTRTPSGTFERFLKGMRAMQDAGVTLRVNSIITKHNEHEIDAMNRLAASFTDDHYTYGQMSATIHGTGEPLLVQSTITRKPVSSKPVFDGCGAGVRSFHVDPLGRTSMCKVGRDVFVHLHEEGAPGMQRLALNSQLKLTRADGCVGCGVQSTCTTCPVIVANYRKAGAPGSFYCQRA